MEKYLEPIFESFEPLNEDEVSEIERSSGVKLPSNYRNFLLKYGRCMFSVEASIETGSEEIDILTWMGGRENGN
ncbi:MAG TPA: SMI1/KNR4 family protein, partial [Pseudomonadales bacterium]